MPTSTINTIRPARPKGRTDDIVEMADQFDIADEDISMDTEEREAPTFFVPILQAWKRDHKDAAMILTRTEVRWLVNMYYQVQEYRISAAAQVRAAETDAEPNESVMYFFAEMRLLEERIKKALDIYTDSNNVGRWLKGVYGIGPVIAAGMMAHIEIERSPTAGNIWRFAGLDPTVIWQGSKAARELVNAAFEAEPTPMAAVLWLSRATTRKPSDMIKAASGDALEELPEADAAAKVLRLVGIPDAQVSEAFERYPLHIDNAINHAIPGDKSRGPAQAEHRAVYELLYQGVRINREEVIKLLAKRPWNADLKRLCWLAGQSFMKFSGRDACYYGKIYRERKQLEADRNARGDNADTAASILQAKRFGRETEAYKALSVGKLPLAQIDARARRYAVKLWISAMHECMYFDRFQRLPPNPYPLEFLGHTHRIDPPNMDAIPGLKEAKEAHAKL